MIKTHVHVRIEAGKRVWSISAGLEMGNRKDTLGKAFMD